MTALPADRHDIHGAGHKTLRLFRNDTLHRLGAARRAKPAAALAEQATEEPA